MDAIDLKLKERVKELKCLYDLSKIALQAGNDLSIIMSKTLTILPHAMQYPELAEVSITVNRTNYVTTGICEIQQSYNILNRYWQKEKWTDKSRV